ncbi:MAG: tetraacyldisaccharide 4'-kinase [Gammaproteobacteria bacterium]
MMLARHWYGQSSLTQILRPIAGLYGGLVALRRMAYRRRILSSYRLPVPVIIVGNITVGGTGKTPLVAWIAELLCTSGYRPGIVTGGYKGRSQQWPQLVYPDSEPLQVGDEAVLLARRGSFPVVAGPDRVAAAETLLAQSNCNVIISDDGLQHYALQRDIEIAVVDTQRLFGNGLYLPAGPLREPVRRLKGVHMVVGNGSNAWDGGYSMTLGQEQACNLKDPSRSCALKTFQGKPVHGVAGIGNPARFFGGLRESGLDVVEHPFPDHHAFQPKDLEFDNSYPILMTEKDAVKCEGFAGPSCWYVPATVQLDGRLGPDLLDRLRALPS